MNIPAMLMTCTKLLPSLDLFGDSLALKKLEFKDIIKIGRTHT